MPALREAVATRDFKPARSDACDPAGAPLFATRACHHKALREPNEGVGLEWRDRLTIVEAEVEAQRRAALAATRLAMLEKARLREPRDALVPRARRRRHAEDARRCASEAHDAVAQVAKRRKLRILRASQHLVKIDGQQVQHLQGEGWGWGSVAARAAR